MEEIWKPIKGAVKGHEVSSLGRVRNRKGRLLKTPSYGHGTKDWYAHLNLNINGTSKTFYVHRLVGLPGEEIIIKEGSIWINGIRAQPPAEISKINFIPAQYGSAESPLRLNSTI